MNLNLVRTAIGHQSATIRAASGVYIWVDKGLPDQPVLYIGEAEDVRKRTGDERVWAQHFQSSRRMGRSLWQAAGCALTPVLDAATDPKALMWPMDRPQRVATEAALIRLAALTGGTPPAQGGGWNWNYPTTDSAKTASALLDEWFAPDHELNALLPQVYPDLLAAVYSGRPPQQFLARWGEPTAER